MTLKDNIISLSIFVLSRLPFILWSSPPSLWLNLPCVQLHIKVPNHTKELFLKWVFINWLIYFGFVECLYKDFLKNNSTSRQSNRKLRLKESAVELTLSPCVWGSQVSTAPLIYFLKQLINYCCRICTILCMIFKKCLFIEALCWSLLRKYAHCKPLFPFQNNA